MKMQRTLLMVRYTASMKFTKMHGLGNDYVYVLPERARLGWADFPGG